MDDFKLSASLEGHGDDVRDVVYPDPRFIFSASRDASVRMWSLTSDDPPTYDATVSSHGTSFVNAVTYIPPSSSYPRGLVVSGGKDTIIEVRQPDESPGANAEALLIGHSHNVCALDVDPASKWIVSGSWDGQARLWHVGRWECDAVLEEHQGSVWAVMFWDSDTVVTGCADKLIRVFNVRGKLLRTLYGNTEVIRALCRVPESHPSEAQLASASNDGIIRLWTLNGREVGQLRGHDSFIYSLASLPSGELVSSGEDRTVRVWQGTTCVQTITHPAISVWCVAACAANGDFVSGASDRKARVFTRAKKRHASAEVLKEFEESVKSSSIPQQQVGDINKENLPGPDFLQRKSGSKEGQVVMIREDNGNVSAHQWSMQTKQWINVGSVVDAVGSSGRKRDYLGQDYDYVFDVDIKEGSPPLKLPYNLSQNPYEAATKFLQDNELPMGYLDQVANFIVTNTRGATIGQDQQPQEKGPDPFGTESRYRPGDGAPQPPPSAAKAPRRLPQKSYLSITQANLKVIRKKIEDLNDELISSGQKDVSLNPSDVAALGTLVEHLEGGTLSEPSKPAAAAAAINNGLGVVIRIVTVWPPAQRLPGLDLLRLLAAQTTALAAYKARNGENLVDILERSGVFDDGDRSNDIMLAVRMFVNLFETTEGRALVDSEFDKIHSLTSSAPSSAAQSNRNLQISYTTLLINFSVLFTTSSSTSANPTDAPSTTGSAANRALTLLEPLTAILKKADSDSEVTYRALVAAGTLVSMDVEEVKSAATEVFGLLDLAKKASVAIAEPRIKEVVVEIEGILGRGKGG